MTEEMMWKIRTEEITRIIVRNKIRMVEELREYMQKEGISNSFLESVLRLLKV